jgi:hypothetical protein
MAFDHKSPYILEILPKGIASGSSSLNEPASCFKSFLKQNRIYSVNKRARASALSVFGD